MIQITEHPIINVRIIGDVCMYPGKVLREWESQATTLIGIEINKYMSPMQNYQAIIAKSK